MNTSQSRILVGRVLRDLSLAKPLKESTRLRKLSTGAVIHVASLEPTMMTNPALNVQTVTEMKIKYKRVNLFIFFFKINEWHYDDIAREADLHIMRKLNVVRNCKEAADRVARELL